MIGAGIITCNRENLFKQCINSMPKVEFLVVINDGKPYSEEVYSLKPDKIIQHKKNKGIAKSKNEAIKILIEHNCEHIFLIEDDISINNVYVFEHYIKTAEDSGIFHLNYAYHGPANKNKEGSPNPKKIIVNKSNSIITLNHNLVGAFSYYHKMILEKVGYFDTQFYNAWEHVDHTYRIIKAGYHPPFWWFADAPDSEKYLCDLDSDLEKSIIRKSKFRWKINLYRNTQRFARKNGYAPSQIPQTDEEDVEDDFYRIVQKFGNKRILKNSN